MAFRTTGLIAWCLLMASLVTACDDDEPVETPEEEPTVEMGPCGHLGEPMTLLLRRLDFVGVDDGVALGLDLDDHVSTTGDEVGCGKGDFTSPDGTPGIDNQFARLLPAIQAVGGEEAFASAITRAINQGGVLVSVELFHLDDTADDACVAVRVGRATGHPDIGNHGLIEAGQTFDRDTEAPTSAVDDATVEGGRLFAGPFTMALPMVVDNIELIVTLREMYVEASLNPDGTASGILAGSIVLEELNEFLDNIAEGTALFAAIRGVLGANADLDPDENGRCQRISIAVGFDAAPMFFFESTE